MGQYVLLSPHGNRKLKALLQGTFLHRMFLFSSGDDLVSLVRSFDVEQAVYLRFSHLPNFQPKFYIGSTSSTILDREHTRFRKFIQVQQNKFVLAEVALRFWNLFDNFWMWSIFPLFTGNPNFWALEQALIQLWQPRLNTPFIYQFFNCWKRTHCTASIFVDTSVRDILSLAQTTLGFNTTASEGHLLQQEIPRQNSTLGSHTAPQLQLLETLPDGEPDSVTRVWPPRLLLRSQAGCQLG